MNAKIGFIGLGKMGYNMAMNVGKKFNTMVYNRTISVAEEHANKFGTTKTLQLSDMAKNSNVIIMCLPTYKEVDDVINKMNKHFWCTKTIIDCTSSDPIYQKSIYNKLIEKGIYYFDAPVSGGPHKAFDGTLTAMVGGNKDKYNEIENILKAFSKPMYVGSIGTGCAIKAINNILNVSHLCIAAEGLEALSKLGIDKNIALKVINQSSGRSLMTQERIPYHIFEKNYNYGFSLGLMRKDILIALDIVKDPIMTSKILELLNKSVDKYGYDADYTEIAKLYFDK